MITLSLLASLAPLFSPPVCQEPATGPRPAAQPTAQPQDEGYGGIVGSLDPRFRARSETKKRMYEAGGVPLVEAYQGTWIWMNSQTPEEGLIQCEDGRNVGTSALAALSMSGNGSGIRAGAQRSQYRVLSKALRADQAQRAAGTDAARAPEFELDTALAVHALAEALISNPQESLRLEVQGAADALLTLRSPDGLWHTGGDAKAPVDALVTGLATYGLYTAQDAGCILEPSVFEAVEAWSAKAEPAGSNDAQRATNTAAILCARTFAAQALENGLKNDEQVARLLAAIDAYLPTSGSESTPATAGQAAANDFAYVASVGLYQADNLRWNRLYQWIQVQALADAAPKQADNTGFAAGNNGRLPAGAIATTSLRLLQLQSGIREPSLACYAN